MNPKNILIVAGEPSGDLHASNLVKDLKRLSPDLRFFGLGGSLSRQAGVDITFDISKLALVGLVEVLKNIFTIGKVYKDLLVRIDFQRPSLAILVDYPGFNLRLAKELKKRSIPVVYYISPQVWAWGRDRIDIIKRCVKKIVVFFAFEEELYKRYGIDAEFVGHPLLDTVRPSSQKTDFLKGLGLSPEKTTVALLPGSRTIEVKALLPIMIDASKEIAKELGAVQFLIAKFKDLPMDLYESRMKGLNFDIRIVDGHAHDALASSDFAIVASGTATLESAIIGTPLIIVYKASLLTYLVAKFIANIRFLGIVNIIAKKEVAPEFIQYRAIPKAIAAKAIEILKDAKRAACMKKGLDAVRSSLGSPGASQRAAKAVLYLINT